MVLQIEPNLMQRLSARPNPSGRDTGARLGPQGRTSGHLWTEI